MKGFEVTGLVGEDEASHPWAADEKTNAKVLFAHIPKTAGTSLLSVLQNTFSDDAVRRVHTGTSSYQTTLDGVLSGSNDDIKCIVGHIPLCDLNKEVNDLVIFTVLRDPVERVLSLFRFFSAFSEEELRLRDLEKGFSLRTFLTHNFPEVFGQVSNGMVRFLCGRPDVFDPHSDRFQLLSLAPDYDEAKSFLETIDFGITERMDSTLLLLQDRWKIPFRMHEYVENTTSAGSVQIMADDRELLMSLNKYDMMLYEWACAEFDRRVKALSTARIQAWNSNAVWSPVIGEPARVGAIPGRVGFYEFENDTLAWLRQGDHSEIHFSAEALPFRIAMNIHAVSDDYDVRSIKLQVNQTPLPFTVVEKGDQWWKLETQAFLNHDSLGTLAIQCPQFVNIGALHRESKDRRHLAVALHDVCFLDETMTGRP